MGKISDARILALASVFGFDRLEMTVFEIVELAELEEEDPARRLRLFIKSAREAVRLGRMDVMEKLARLFSAYDKPYRE